MLELQYVPHINQFLRALRIESDRLNSRSKVAIGAGLLKVLLKKLVEREPFSERYYLQTYPDIAEAYSTGQITDLKQHYVEYGYFEGRLGSPAEVNEEYYLRHNEDVRQAVMNGRVESASEHYRSAGYAEGRVPNETMKPIIDEWFAALDPDS